MGKFEEKEMIKKRPFVKSTWYNWLINYIDKTIKKQCVVLRILKCVVLSLFKTNIITKDYRKPTCVSNLYGGGKKPRKQKIKSNPKTA